MLIACKCLNIILKSAADHLPSTTSATISDYDDITIRTKTSIGLPSNMVSSTNDNNFDDNRQEQSPFIQDSTVEKLKSDQFHFFKTVSNGVLLPVAVSQNHLYNIFLFIFCCCLVSTACCFASNFSIFFFFFAAVPLKTFAHQSFDSILFSLLFGIRACIYILI